MKTLLVLILSFSIGLDSNAYSKDINQLLRREPKDRRWENR